MPLEKYRAINEGPQSDVAQTRHHLYRCCITRVNEALSTGFYVEAVAIIESMIADRLESRVAFKHAQDREKRKYSTLGLLVKDLKVRDGESAEALAIYERIVVWSRRRNHVIHQLVKLEESEEPDWDKRYQEARDTAETGIKLFRKLDKCVSRLNRDPTP